MILQDNPADFERHEWGFSVIMKSASWYLPGMYSGMLEPGAERQGEPGRHFYL